MEQYQQSKDILNLGNKLVEELNMIDSNDTLSRWMAHYIAELIHNAEKAEGEAKIALEKECCDTILKLWAIRNASPHAIRPLAELENAILLLKNVAYKLDGHWDRYYEGSDNPWIKFGAEVNDANRDIIRLLIFLQSIDTDMVNIKKWVSDHSTLLSTEEREIVEGLDKIIGDIEYYYQLQELRNDSTNAKGVIMTHLEKLVEENNKALKDLKSSLL